jgi:hypothetical protein
MADVFIPTTNQIRAGINSLEMIDEQVAHEPILASLYALSGDERKLAEQAADTGGDEFAAGFLLGLATARQQ